MTRDEALAALRAPAATPADAGQDAPTDPAEVRAALARGSVVMSGRHARPSVAVDVLVWVLAALLAAGFVALMAGIHPRGRLAAVAAIVPRRANRGLNDHENRVLGNRAAVLRSRDRAGSGGGRESNPPATQRAAHRF